MKITVLSSLLREPWMIDHMHALSSGATVMQLIDPDQRKFTERGKLETRLISIGMDYWQDNIEDPENNPELIPSGTIAVVPLHGVMLKYGTMCSYGMMEIAQELQRLMKDQNVSGIILDIDSPGGAVNAIPPIIDVLKARTKPVLMLSDCCCSAGYYASLYADHHMASNDISARYGSIGVMISFADMQPMWEKQGVKFHTILPPESPDKNLSFELAREGKYEMIIEEMLSPMAKRFQKDVRERRGAKLKEAPGVLTGKTFDATTALEYGLIDSIGNFNMAVEKLSLMIELKQFLNQ